MLTPLASPNTDFYKYLERCRCVQTYSSLTINSLLWRQNSRCVAFTRQQPSQPLAALGATNTAPVHESSLLYLFPPRLKSSTGLDNSNIDSVAGRTVYNSLTSFIIRVSTADEETSPNIRRRNINSRFTLRESVSASAILVEERLSCLMLNMSTEQKTKNKNLVFKAI